MKPIHASILALSLTLVVVPLAFAWPDQPPDSATIAGPGLAGNVTISDPTLLKNLSLGSMEDFSAPVAAPDSSVAYTIHRHFYDDTFDFGVLTYVAVGGGYVRFDDGPDFSGTHTPYNGRWYRVTHAGQQALSAWLAEEVQPHTSGQAVQLPRNASVWVWLIALLGILLVGGALGLQPSRPVQS